jgi:hypothetical protein
MVVLQRSFVCALALSALGASSFGQTLTGRSSTLNFNYVYGAGGDTNVGDGGASDAALLQADGENASFSNSTAGFLPGDQPYAASALSSLQQEYIVTGPLSQFQSIRGTASTRVAVSSSGLGSSLMNASNPGNELMLLFSLDAAAPYTLSGNVSSPTGGAFTGVSLQQFDGIVWQNVFNSIFLPAQQGAFDVAGNLSAGSYRLTSAISLNSFGNADLTSTTNFLFTIPGPSALAMLGLGGLVVSRRRRA